MKWCRYERVCTGVHVEHELSGSGREGQTDTHSSRVQLHITSGGGGDRWEGTRQLRTTTVMVSFYLCDCVSFFFKIYGFPHLLQQSSLSSGSPPPPPPNTPLHDTRLVLVHNGHSRDINKSVADV